MGKTPRTLVLGAVTALVVGACTSDPGPSPAPPPATALSQRPPSPGPVATAAFGQDFSWDDGLGLTVDGPDPFTPSATAYVAGGRTTVAFTLTVRNETPTAWNPALLFVSLTAGDAEAAPVFDAEKGVGARPDEPVPPSGEVQVRLAFAVPREGDLVLRVTPGLAYAPAVFTR